MMKYSYGVIHGYAKCDDCGWETSSYKNAQATAAIHAKRQNHIVRGDFGAGFAYYGRDE